MDKYTIAMKAGKKEIQNCLASHRSTELPVLNRILENVEVVGEIPLGLMDIPLDLVVGTKTSGRSSSFAPNFMPILNEGSEFAIKWSCLCEAHLREGIHDPIIAYEYMNNYYVLEGNKRVSVMKYFKADSIAGYVTRIIPARTDTPESRLYYEFLDFYQNTNINYIIFSREGSYIRLNYLLGHWKYERWTPEERFDFRSCYNRFSQAYEELDGKKLSITISDAFLIYIETFGYRDIKNASPEDIRTNIQKIWNDLATRSENIPPAVQYDPSPEQKKHFLSLLLPAKSEQVTKIAFIYGHTAESSDWTYAHELGRLHVAETFRDSIRTSVYDGIQTPDDVEDAIERAIADGNEMIFTTAPDFLPASLKSAANHPGIKILNCSQDASHTSLRTYSGRAFEAKFLVGVLAGIMTDTGKIGYIATHPIHGEIANINAFARGVKMVNSQARVYLEWTTLKDNQNVDLTDRFYSMGATYISHHDMIIPQSPTRQIGLFRVNGEIPVNLALPVWDWGRYYELIIRSVQNGSWNAEKKNDTDSAVSYWWGMSAGVIDVIYSSGVPQETQLLLNSLRRSICNYELTPFDGILTSQNNIVQPEAHYRLTAKEIISINWLADNIVGRIPDISELVPEAKPLVSIEGIRK